MMFLILVFLTGAFAPLSSSIIFISMYSIIVFGFAKDADEFKELYLYDDHKHNNQITMIIFGACVFVISILYFIGMQIGMLI